MAEAIIADGQLPSDESQNQKMRAEERMQKAYYLESLKELKEAEFRTLVTELRQRCTGRFPAERLAAISDESLVRQCLAGNKWLRENMAIDREADRVAAEAIKRETDKVEKLLDAELFKSIRSPLVHERLFVKVNNKMIWL